MISDADGNLLLSCNGVKVHNRFDEKIPGSDTLGNVDGATLYLLLYPNAFNRGIIFPQQHISLPSPVGNGYYDIFYTIVDTFNVPGGYMVGAKKVLKSTVDINGNMGHGSMLTKDKPVLKDEGNAHIIAVRHGNGTDWWVCTNRTSTNCYNLTYSNGVNEITHSQCGGGIVNRDEFFPMRFSQNGNTFASAAVSGLNIFDFDRCSGTLNLIEHVDISEFIDSSQWFPSAIEFSPNNRFVYVFSSPRIFQYDLMANPISSSKKIIASYDPNFGCPFGQSFFGAQLAPDGKIYINSGNTNYCLSVINNPDGEGDLCGFIRYGVDLPNFISGLPHFPNYRLGALPGSACDTLTSIKDIAEKEKILKVFPNPASDVATIDYGFTDWSKGEATLEIANALGQIVHKQALPMYSGFQKLDVANYASGSYTVYIKRKGLVVATGRLVKE